MTIPTYQDIVDQLVADAQNIYGSDIYLGTDSQDYQWISSFSKMIYDSFLTAQAVYNSRGPATALGAGLDAIVGINGIQRKAAVYSTATETIAGIPGTPITGGVVADVNGNYWSLPSPTIIGSSGSVTVTVTCQTAGAITANPGDINVIVTPVLGWTSATNPNAATVGSPQETDSQLRARQATSTAQPSQSILEGLKGALAALSGVNRYKVYENDTGSTNSLGLPPHSITCVMDGGNSTDIATTIFDRKGPGCATNGTTTVPVTDSYGVTTDINYDVVTEVPIDVSYAVKQISGYTTDTTTAIQNAAANFLNANGIGNNVYNSSLWGAALTVNTDPSNPVFSITSVTAAVHLGATLQTSLTSGTAYTSIDVSALTYPVTSGDNLVIGAGSTTQMVTANADAAIGATSISVNSFTANAAYATGTTVAFEQTTSDLTIDYNQAAQGVTGNISVTPQ